jgi:hypothetical protein
MAAFFAIDNPIQIIQAKRIIEHAGGQPERDPMLGDVHAILTLVPFKNHRIYIIAVYTTCPFAAQNVELVFMRPATLTMPTSPGGACPAAADSNAQPDQKSLKKKRDVANIHSISEATGYVWGGSSRC